MLAAKAQVDQARAMVGQARRTTSRFPFTRPTMNPPSPQFRRDRAQQQADRNNHSRLSIFRPDDDSFNPGERPVIDGYSLARFQIRPRCASYFGTYQSLDGTDFGFADGDRSISEAHDLCHAGGIQDSHSVRQRKTAEQICFGGQSWALSTPATPILDISEMFSTLLVGSDT